ncbi:MAG: MBL fold metallo-hydrolase [Olsenella sp.]|jgi:ribonuclease/clavin/mitogillin|nr:MBL fold metallo-hydrolase [Olsenella sp.]
MHERIITLPCGHTTCYLVVGATGALLVDTGFAGTLDLLGRGLKANGLGIQDVRYLLVTHFHPDHMGIAQDLADLGVTLLLPTCQLPYVHTPDHMYARDHNDAFQPIDETAALHAEPPEIRRLLHDRCGIDGMVVQTPGHSPDSISLVLDQGDAFVGDLCPSDQVCLYADGAMEASWEAILSLGAHTIHFAHWPGETI